MHLAEVDGVDEVVLEPERRDTVSRRSLLTIADLDRAEIARILRVGNRFAEVMERDIKKVPTLRGRTIINMFFEASTRTSTSFELAGKRLSADVVNVKGSGSSVEKGETLKDTVITLDAYAPDVLVIRHASVGACQMAARYTDAAVINAGDGKHEHPTQTLLDLYTIEREVGPLDGLHIAFVGDVAHSRVARSGIRGFQTMGARVTPDRAAHPASRATPSEALGVDDLHRHPRHRRRRRRLRAAHAARADGPRRLRALAARVRRRPTGSTTPACGPASASCTPGPINRGVEISGELADDPEDAHRAAGRQRHGRADGGALRPARRALGGAEPAEHPIGAVGRLMAAAPGAAARPGRLARHPRRARARPRRRHRRGPRPGDPRRRGRR